jgi:hypothetical protein
MALAANERASNQVRAIASLKLEQLKSWLVANAPWERMRTSAHFFTTRLSRSNASRMTRKMNLTRPQDPLMANRSGWIGAATGRAGINLASVEFVLVQANGNA